MRNAEQILIF